MVPSPRNLPSHSSCECDSGQGRPGPARTCCGLTPGQPGVILNAMAYSQLYDDYFRRSQSERGQSGAALTGTIAAGLAANGVIWTLRYPETTPMPSASRLVNKRLCVQRIHVHTVTGTAFTTAVTLGRHLKLVRMSGPAGTSNPSGGAAWTPVRKRSDGSETLAVGRIATTGALTITGFTLESNVIQRYLMSAVGDSGAQYDEVWRFDGVEADPLILLPGQALAIAAGAEFDAAGTFEADISCDMVEVP